MKLWAVVPLPDETLTLMVWGTLSVPVVISSSISLKSWVHLRIGNSVISRVVSLIFSITPLTLYLSWSIRSIDPWKDTTHSARSQLLMYSAYLEASEPGRHFLRLLTSHHPAQVLDDIKGIIVWDGSTPTWSLSLTVQQCVWLEWTYQYRYHLHHWSIPLERWAWNNLVQCAYHPRPSSWATRHLQGGRLFESSVEGLWRYNEQKLRLYHLQDEYQIGRWDPADWCCYCRRSFVLSRQWWKSNWLHHGDMRFSPKRSRQAERPWFLWWGFAWNNQREPFADQVWDRRPQMESIGYYQPWRRESAPCWQNRRWGGIEHHDQGRYQAANKFISFDTNSLSCLSPLWIDATIPYDHPLFSCWTPYQSVACPPAAWSQTPNGVCQDRWNTF